MLIAAVMVVAFVIGIYVRTFATAFEEYPPDARAEARAAIRRTLRTPPVPALPPVVEVTTALACGLVAWRVGPVYLPALLYAAVAGVALAVIDWRTSRLPDVITLPSYPVLALLLIPTGELPRGLLGGLALAGLYGLLWFARPSAMGLGDVKLAGLIGMVTGALGWDTWVFAAIAGQLCGAVYAINLLVVKKADKKTEFPLGPFMLIGALAAVCLA